MHPYFPFLRHSYFPKIVDICFLVTPLCLFFYERHKNHKSIRILLFRSCAFYPGSGCTLYDGLSPVISAAAAKKKSKKIKYPPKKVVHFTPKYSVCFTRVYPNII